MRKFLMFFFLFCSMFTFSKELKFKFFANGKTYIITDKDYTDIPVEYIDNQFMIFKFKIINNGLSDDNYILEIKHDNKKYKINGIKEIEHIPLNKTWNYFIGSKNGFIRFSTGKKFYADTIDANNDVQLKPALIDTNIDLLKSSISDFDNRKINKIKLNNKYNLWGRYTTEYNESKFPNYFKTIFIKNIGLKYQQKSKNNTFFKKSIIQNLNIGIDKVYNNSSTGIFLAFGLENSRGYETSKFGDGNKLEILKDKKNGFYVSDTLATMFGIGINHTKSFSNGIYYDALAQISGFNRNMTSHDGQYANSTAFATSLSFETGINKKFNYNMVSITPQVQQIYHYYHQNKFTNSLDITMPKINKHIFDTRFGMKVEHKNFYEKLNIYLDYAKYLNSINMECEFGFDEKINEKFNIHSSLSYQQEIYNKNFKSNINKKIKSNLGIIY